MRCSQFLVWYFAPLFIFFFDPRATVILVTRLPNPYALSAPYNYALFVRLILGSVKARHLEFVAEMTIYHEISSDADVEYASVLADDDAYK